MACSAVGPLGPSVWEHCLGAWDPDPTQASHLLRPGQVLVLCGFSVPKQTASSDTFPQAPGQPLRGQRSTAVTAAIRDGVGMLRAPLLTPVLHKVSGEDVGSGDPRFPKGCSSRCWTQKTLEWFCGQSQGCLEMPLRLPLPLRPWEPSGHSHSEV